ncbi:hypothetical protein ABEX25_20540 [Paenibacillus thiaminolyticus]|uniref:hypothetical protein n=1 Tax=Paenibacillus thiaminolyticus TaxID=49283 RepID=UPI003D2D22D9
MKEPFRDHHPGMFCLESLPAKQRDEHNLDRVAAVVHQHAACLGLRSVLGGL